MLTKQALEHAVELLEKQALLPQIGMIGKSLLNTINPTNIVSGAKTMWQGAQNVITGNRRLAGAAKVSSMPNALPSVQLMGARWGKEGTNLVNTGKTMLGQGAGQVAGAGIGLYGAYQGGKALFGGSPQPNAQMYNAAYPG